MKNIELILTNRCNNKCVFCHSPLAADPMDFSAQTCRKLLQWGRKTGATGVYFGGGEPTVMSHLADLASYARESGYERIRLLTNGVRLADSQYADSLIQAGMNEFEIALKGHNAETHDALTQTPGSFEKAGRAVTALARKDVLVVLTILITARNYRFLTDMVLRFARRGVKKFSFWLISLHDTDRKAHVSLLPSLTDIVPFVVNSFEEGNRLGLEMDSCHIPACFLPARHRSHVLNARGLALLVISKNSRFMLEASPYEGGVKLPECLKCKEEPECLGLRSDYIETFGGAEVCPINSREKEM